MLRRLIICLASLVFAASCASLEEAGGAGSLRSRGTGDGSGVAAAELTGDLDEALYGYDDNVLPTAMSQIWEHGDVGLYFAALEGQQYVIGFDLNSGAELYRFETNPIGHLRGLPPELLIDDDLGIVITTQIVALNGSEFARAQGHLISDGSLQWIEKTMFDADVPYRCGNKMFCVRSDGQVLVFSAETGKGLSSGESLGTSVIASDDDLIVSLFSPADDYSRTGLAGHSFYGLNQLWTLDDAQLTAFTGQVLDRGNGWGAYVDPDTSVIGITIALSEGDSEATFGVERTSGELVWSVPGATRCVHNQDSAQPMVRCLESADDPSLVDRLVRLDVATGEVMWSVPFDQGYATFEQEIVVGADSVWVWSTDGGPRRYDLQTGVEIPVGDVALCVNWGAWAELVLSADGTTADYASAIHTTMCAADGSLLSPNQMAASMGAVDWPGSTRVVLDPWLSPSVISG